MDLFLFMGQSNMAGRGAVSEEHREGCPEILDGAGYEFRAVSAPGRLCRMCEPFGRYEDREGGIDDGGRKTGSLVTAFTNAYFERTGVPVVGVSASKGGSSISQWQPGGAFMEDVLSRLDASTAFLIGEGYEIRHKYMLWCQGETDGDLGRDSEEYRGEFEKMLEEMLGHGIERCFLIRIGHYNGSDSRDYRRIMAAQEETARANPNVVMVSRAFAEMKARGLMKDAFHYYQQAYNEVGREAGRNAGDYVEGGCP